MNTMQNAASHVRAEADLDTFYQNKSILLTGASGFLGKAILEKFVRSIDLGAEGQVFVLIRGKTEEDVQRRLESEILASEIFDTMRRRRADFASYFSSKVTAVRGDMTQEGLGLSTEDLNMLAAKVNVIVHSAASVLFDEPLNQLLEKNVLGTERVFDLAKDCRMLDSMVYVSSMAPNTNQLDGSWVEEKIYTSDRSGQPFDAETELASILAMNEQQIEAKTSDILKQWPNTYCYSKFLSEHLLASRTTSTRVPLIICRPSMVAAALREPVPGWIDSRVGFGAGLLAIGSGLKTLWYGSGESTPDIVPVDLCANAIIAAAARRDQLLDHSRRRAFDSARNPYAGSVPVVMLGSSSNNPVSWAEVGAATSAFFRAVPMTRQIAKPSPWLTKNRLLYAAYNAVVMEAPAMLVEGSRRCGLAVDSKLARGLSFRAQQSRRLEQLLGPFVSTSWRFEARACPEVLCSAAEDAAGLAVDVSAVAWEGYLQLNCYGMLRYVAKDWHEAQQRAAVVAGLSPDALARAALGCSAGSPMPLPASRSPPPACTLDCEPHCWPSLRPAVLAWAGKAQRGRKPVAVRAARMGGLLALCAVAMLALLLLSTASLQLSTSLAQLQADPQSLPGGQDWLRSAHHPGVYADPELASVGLRQGAAVLAW